MSDATPLFTDAELATQAQGNASVLAYLLAHLSKTWRHTPAEAALLTGRAFAPGWASLKGQGPAAVARVVALNLASLGGSVTVQEQAGARVDVHVRGYPTEEDAAFFGVSRDDADQLLGAFGPIAEFLGMQASWHRAGEEIVVTVEQAVD